MIRRRLVLAAGVVLALLGTGSALPGAAQASGHKTYTLTMTPCVNAGDAAIVVATLANTAIDQRLGSANITLGSNLASPKSLDPKADVRNGVVEVRNVDIRPGGSYAVELLVDPAAPKTTGTSSVAAKQSNDFKGTGNDFTLNAAKSQLNTKVAEECGFDDGIHCAEDTSEQDCSVTLRHYVPCSYVTKLNPTTSCGSSGGSVASALDAGADAGGALDLAYFVETTVAAAPVTGGTDAGPLALWYETQQDQNNGTPDEVFDAGCELYTEPSNLAARFVGPPNRSMTVTYRISGMLWYETGNEGSPASCFSAPYPYAGVYDSVPGFKFDELFWFNAILLQCGVAAPGNPCQASNTESQDGGWTTVDTVPYSPVEIPDPMRY